MKYSYEYNEDSVQTINNRIDWFFRLDVLDTIRNEEKVLHWRVSKSNLINIFTLILLHSCDFTKSIDSNHLSKAFIKKAFSTVVVRKLYSYEVNVKNSSCWLFKIIISWLEIWDETALNSTKTLLWIDLSIAMSHVWLFATTLDNNISKTRREEFIAAIACCLLRSSLCDVNLLEDDQFAQLLFVFRNQLLFCETVWNLL